MSEAVRTAVKAPETKKGIQVSQVQRGNFNQPLGSPVEQILFLQRTIGNQAVQRLMKSGALQAKLRTGAPGNAYEQEADRVAEQVMRMPEQAGPSVSIFPPAQSSDSGAAAHALRPLPGGAATRPILFGAVAAVQPRDPSHGGASHDVPASVAATVGAFGTNLLLAAISGSAAPHAFTARMGSAIANVGAGTPLPASVRAPFEYSFGYDLSPVRVHSGPAAARAARAASALAFALGDHVVLGADIDSSTALGRRIIGHELAHAVQARLGGGAGRISDPSWSSEREANRAVDKAMARHHYEITEPGGDNLQRIAPWVILAGIGLVAGLVIWAVSDSPEENQRRHAAGDPDASREVWALIPVYGSIQQIREAESYFQRVLGVGFLMLDFATLGTAGIAARALIRAPGALVRSAIARRGATLAVREGGELASEAAAREASAAFIREGGVIVASRQAAASEMMQALGRGSFVVVTEGGLNHAVIYARNAAGQVLRIHGGPLRVLFEEAPRAMTPQVASSIAQRVNAYVVVEAGQAAVSIEQAIAGVQRGGPAILRWLGGTPTSCGIVQGAVLEAVGLPAATLQRLVPAGGAAARMLPITVFDHMLASGGVRLVEGGAGRIIGGTLIQGSLLATGGLIPAVTSAMLRVTVNQAFMSEPSGAWAPDAQPRLGGGFIGNLVGRAVLRARAMVNPANWDTSALRVRSRTHLAVIGGAMLLAQTPDAFLTAVSRPLSSFNLGTIPGELAQDVNAALLARGGFATMLATYTADFIGRQTAPQLIDLLERSGVLRYRDNLDAIVARQLASP